MKRIPVLVIFFMVCSTTIFAQQAIKFLDIEWGIPKEVLVSIMQEKGFTLGYVDGDRSVDFNGPIAGGTGDISLYLYKDQFYRANIILKTYIPTKEIAAILAEKYGPPTSSSSRFEYLGSYYTWELNERGRLDILDAANILTMDYTDGKILVQKKRDELSGL